LLAVEAAEDENLSFHGPESARKVKIIDKISVPDPERDPNPPDPKLFGLKDPNPDPKLIILDPDPNPAPDPDPLLFHTKLRNMFFKSTIKSTNSS